ncbi:MULTISPECIES: hypothetical protein [unclassified Providencia]|uniref:hypothetical protein n=1 Tax=unclassified Providencia TaxID=2633465 RepID=UPI00234ACBE3|nr:MULTISPECIES: hypothetical protein [unclassified Providencia]
MKDNFKNIVLSVRVSGDIMQRIDSHTNAFYGRKDIVIAAQLAFDDLDDKQKEAYMIKAKELNK